MPATDKSRTYSAAHFLLELDGKKTVGLCHSIEGGGIKAEIISQRNGNEHREWKQLSKPKYEDIKIQVGMSMSDTFYQWIESFFAGKVDRRDGAILAGDFRYIERARREMYQMLISEIAMPTLDGKDKSPCHMTVTICPERVEFRPGTEAKIATSALAPQKLWTASNFSLQIKGFEDACKRITRVEGFTIRQQILEYAAGNLRELIRVPGRIEFPNLSFMVPEADAAKFLTHFEKHVQKGERQVSPRLTGALEYRSQKGDVLCTVSLSGIDIASVDPGKADATSEDIKTAKVEITVEEMKFEYGRR